MSAINFSIMRSCYVTIEMTVNYSLDPVEGTDKS